MQQLILHERHHVMSDDATGLVVAVDIGGTRMRVSHARDGKVGESVDDLPSQQLDVTAPHEVLVAAVLEHLGTSASSPDAVVLGIPGMIDQDSDEISSCNNVPALHGRRLRASLAEALGCRVLLQQDIMLQLLGEHRSGAAQGENDAFGVYFGTGIGSARLQASDPYRTGAATLQAGHVPLGIDGVQCACGNTDCVEAYASGRTLEQLAAKHAVTLSRLFLDRDGKPDLDAALQRFVRYQGCLLATVSVLLSPDIIVIGGGIPNMPGYPRAELLDRAIAQLQRPRPKPESIFRFAELGESASLHGALHLLELERTSTTT